MACGATLKRTYDFDPLHSPHSSPKRRRCSPMTLAPVTPPIKHHSAMESPFAEASQKFHFTPEQVAASITMEIRRMQKRRQLTFPTSSQVATTSTLEQTDNLSASPTNNASGCAMSSSALLNNLSPSKRDIPLFTFKQVGMICERLLKEREKNMSEHYNKILSEKLAEQYEAFLKFNHDQLHRRFADGSASYVS